MRGCCVKVTPTTAEPDGCVWMPSLLAAAGLTTTLSEVTDANAPLVNWIVIVSAVLYERFEKLAMPPLAATAVVPCSVPVPEKRAAVIERVSLDLKLPY